MDLLAYQRAGNGPALVLIHGYISSSATWARQLTSFARNFDVICPDLAGFGSSAQLVAPTTITDHARLVLRLLKKLRINAFFLLGHSMGGMVAQEITRLAPEKINALILYGTGPDGILPGRFETIDDSRRRLLDTGIPAAYDKIVASWFMNGRAAESFVQSQQVAEKVSLSTALACLSAWEQWSGVEYLSEIFTPTLVLWGSHDRSYQWSQPCKLWCGIKNADLAVVPVAAHAVHLEAPEIFENLVMRFLLSLKAER